jgi:hypothetical protein
MSVYKSIASPIPLDKIFIKLSNGDSIEGIVQVWDVVKDGQSWCAIKDINGYVLNINIKYIMFFQIERQAPVVKKVEEPDIKADLKNKEEKERIEEVVKVAREKNVLVRKVIKEHMQKPVSQIPINYSDGSELLERK